MIEKLRNFKLPYREDVIRKDDGKIIVDWEKITEMEKMQKKELILLNYCMERMTT